MSESHLHGGDGFTFLHVKEFILLNKSIDHRFFDVVHSFMKGFQRVPHSLRGFAMRDKMILIHSKRGN